jgi:hypothetical protein
MTFAGFHLTQANREIIVTYICDPKSQKNQEKDQQSSTENGWCRPQRRPHRPPLFVVLLHMKLR